VFGREYRSHACLGSGLRIPKTFRSKGWHSSVQPEGEENQGNLRSFKIPKPLQFKFVQSIFMRERLVTGGIFLIVELATKPEVHSWRPRWIVSLTGPFGCARIRAESGMVDQGYRHNDRSQTILPEKMSIKGWLRFQSGKHDLSRNAMK